MAEPQGYTKMVMVFGCSEVSLCPVVPGRETGKEQEGGHSPNFSALVKGIARAGEMAQRLRALTALSKVLSSNPSNHMVAHNHL